MLFAPDLNWQGCNFHECAFGSCQRSRNTVVCNVWGLNSSCRHAGGSKTQLSKMVTKHQQQIIRCRADESPPVGPCLWKSSGKNIAVGMTFSDCSKWSETKNDKSTLSSSIMCSHLNQALVQTKAPFQSMVKHRFMDMCYKLFLLWRWSQKITKSTRGSRLVKWVVYRCRFFAPDWGCQGCNFNKSAFGLCQCSWITMISNR